MNKNIRASFDEHEFANQLDVEQEIILGSPTDTMKGIQASKMQPRQTFTNEALERQVNYV